MSEPINAGPSESPEQTTWGVGPWQGEWPADAGTPDEPNPDSLLDPELLLNGDTRNVLDQYRYWKMEAIIASLDQRRHKYHVAIENWQHDLNIGSIVRSANAFLAADGNGLRCVELTVEDDRLRVQVRDDGVGGADLNIGTGLRGLRDRVDAMSR